MAELLCLLMSPFASKGDFSLVRWTKIFQDGESCDFYVPAFGQNKLENSSSFSLFSMDFHAVKWKCLVFSRGIGIFT